jgi:KUP system potassium uptake protein
MSNHFARIARCVANRQRTMTDLTIHKVHGNLGRLGLAALGVVFGDIGTSPLYTLKTVLAVPGIEKNDATVLGILSLVVWTLIIITSIKYVSFAMRVDNDGEGGILALMSLLGVKRQHRPVIIAVGLFGAALIYGDGAITPAISVLSALEGFELATPAMAPFILPVAVAVLVALFALQPLGTARIGRAFGPIMLIWFLAMAVLGLRGIIQHPAVLFALNPYYAVQFLLHGGAVGFLILGAVFLCVTGAEALYADMGHFGAGPIRLAWHVVVFPSLVLNYAGQAALVLQGAPTDQNIFYRLCPEPILMPLILLATLATIIASQSIITGAFSMTRQAIQLGWMPRLVITQTSEEGYGQIYVGAVNWILMIVTVGLALAFKKSDNLAAAYGIAVSATMLMTTVLLFIAMREIWRWSLLASGAVAGAFFIVDASFFAANSLKVTEGGYVPLLLAVIVYGLMYIWHRGASVVAAQFAKETIPIASFVEDLPSRKIARVPGVAIFLTRSMQEAPPIVVWHVQQNHSLHEQVVAITVITESIPFWSASKRVDVAEIAPNFWRATGTYGFMERPNVPHLLEQIQARFPRIDLADPTYYVGVETIVASKTKDGLPRWQEALFAVMQRNAAHVTDFFNLPSERVVEIGRQISI